MSLKDRNVIYLEYLSETISKLYNFEYLNTELYNLDLSSENKLSEFLTLLDHEIIEEIRVSKAYLEYCKSICIENNLTVILSELNEYQVIDDSINLRQLREELESIADRMSILIQDNR